MQQLEYKWDSTKMQHGPHVTRQHLIGKSWTWQESMIGLIEKSAVRAQGKEPLACSTSAAGSVEAILIGRLEALLEKEAMEWQTG